MDYSDLLKGVDLYYKNRFNEYGNSPRGVDWNSSSSQIERFEILINNCGLKLLEISDTLDFGCGYGALFEYLLHKGYLGKYTGIDLVEEYIIGAKAKYSDHPNAIFQKNYLVTQSHQIVFASGIFNVMSVSREQWIKNYVVPTILNLVSNSNNVNLNFLKSEPNRPKEHLFYVSTQELIDRIKFTNDYEFVVDEHLPWEWSVSIRRIANK